MEDEDKSLQSKEIKEEKIAKFGTRSIAFIIDCIILGITGVLLGFLYKPVLLGIGAFGRVIGFIIVLLYFGLLNSKIAKGQSLGKKLMKIKVVNQKGEVISPLRSFARAAILETPFFLNNWMLPSSLLKPIIGSIISFIVFIIGGIIIYLFIFNKETRQSLHDLACRTYVVKEESEGEIEPQKIAIVHYIVSGVLILSFFIFSFIIVANSSEDPLMSELHSALEGLYEKENVLHAQIYVEKRKALHTGQTTTFVRSTIILREEPESRQPEAKSIAKYLIDNISEAKEKDAIVVIINHGFDIGIASWWHSENFSFSPSELTSEDGINVNRGKSYSDIETDNVRELIYAETVGYDRAIQEYTRAVETNPENIEAYFKRGNAYAHKGEYEKAIQDYDKVIELNPRHSGTYSNRGLVYNDMGEFDRAIKDFNKAIELNPVDTFAYNNRGLAYQNKGEYDRAIQNYNKTIELDPEFALAYNNRGFAYNNKREYDRAIQDLNKAIELDPEFALAYNNRGLAYQNKGKYDRAIQDYSKAIQLKPKFVFAYYNRGNTYREKGEYDRAIKDYNKTIELEPRYPIAYNNRGFTYNNKGEYDRAIRDFNKVIELDPNYAFAYYNRGNAYTEKGEYDQAIQDYNKAIELDSRNTEFYIGKRKIAEELKEKGKQ